MRELKGLLLYRPRIASDEAVAGELCVRTPGSLVGLLLELGGAVRESNIEFFGSLHDGLPVNNGGSAHERGSQKSAREPRTYLVLADTVLAISPQ